MSGSIDFLRRTLPLLEGCARVMVAIDIEREGATRSALQRYVKDGHDLCTSFDLRPLVVGDAAVGGATDAQHFFGFGRDLSSPITPEIEPGLRRTVRNVLDGGVEGRFTSVLREALPPLVNPARAVLWHGGILRPEGLFPCRSPDAKVYCPSHKLRRHWLIRGLTIQEKLRLYQMPLSMDAALEGLNPSRRLPFSDAPSPDIFTSLFRQLWGTLGGGMDLDISLEIHNETVEQQLKEDMDEVVEQVDPNADAIEVHREDMDEVGEQDDPNAAAIEDHRDMKISTTEETEALDQELDPSKCDESDSEMTAGTLPDEATWQFGFEWDHDQAPGGRSTDDDDTITSVASAETLEICPRRCINETIEEASTLEEHELGPAPKTNPGPPYAVGDIVMCDPPGPERLQRAYVLDADHPRYKLRLESGRTLSTFVGRTGAWMTPRYAPGEFAPDQDDPFASIRTKNLRIGSFGIHIDAQLESLRKVQEAKEYAKAVKADDAKIPVHLWNDEVNVNGVRGEQRDRALDGLRKLGHSRFLRQLTRDALRFMRETHGDGWTTAARINKEGQATELEKDRAAIAGVLWHSGHTTWFEYNAGSRLIHFRFPERYRTMARDGVPVWFERPGPTTREKQPVIDDPILRAKAKEKIEKVVKRRYLVTKGIAIKSLIKYFAVPKGDDDVRMVYDATANKLNECVWVPTFWLPTIDTLVRGLDEHTWMTDRDVGDMFLNYQLHSTAMPFTGVDLSSLYESENDIGPRWAVWDRNLMGFAASPYNSIKTALVVEEICRGDRHEKGVGSDGKELNPFQWERVGLNLPGSKSYDPCQPWLVKTRADGRKACDMHTFVDDERVHGPDQNLTWQSSHVLAGKQGYVGVQDAGRKARPSSKTPGAWAGSIVHIIPGLGVCVLTSNDKWIKMKSILEKWLTRVPPGQPVKLNHKELLSDRGFLVYVTRTYPAMIPYMKGFHLTIKMWRGGRDAEGWKLKDVSSVGDEETTSAEDDDMAGLGHKVRKRGDYKVKHGPDDGFTTPVPRFRDDLEALTKLTSSDLPPLRVVRPSQVVQVFYGFGDASGKQFGATISQNYNCKARLSKASKGDGGVRYRIGLWTAEEEEESSNYKELKNLVDTVEEEALAGRLKNCEFFLFTDNSTAESCFYRGNSKSRQLHALVLALRMLEMSHGMTIHVVHVSGKRMIAQGTDGCSRGSLMEGVMSGRDMLSFIDLGRTAVERHPPLLDWVRSWTDQPALEALTPEGWFEEGHGITGGSPDRHGVWMPAHEPAGRLHLWTPQPPVADAALEQLLMARHKRTDSFHVILIPRLMTPRWRRLFLKASDFTFIISPGSSLWPSDMFEPLWVGIVLPFTHHRPWCFGRAPLLVELGRELRGVLETGEGDAGNILRKLLALPRRVAGLPQHVACGVLHVPGPAPKIPDRANTGRDGKRVA